MRRQSRWLCGGMQGPGPSPRPRPLAVLVLNSSIAHAHPPPTPSLPAFLPPLASPVAVLWLCHQAYAAEVRELTGATSSQTRADGARAAARAAREGAREAWQFGQGVQGKAQSSCPGAPYHRQLEGHAGPDSVEGHHGIIMPGALFPTPCCSSCSCSGSPPSPPPAPVSFSPLMMMCSRTLHTQPRGSLQLDLRRTLLGCEWGGGRRRSGEGVGAGVKGRSRQTWARVHACMHASRC